MSIENEEICPQTKAELDSVFEMLTEAKKYGLLVEVIYSFGNERASGVETGQACSNALYEWDI